MVIVIGQVTLLYEFSYLLDNSRLAEFVFKFNDFRAAFARIQAR